MPEPNYKVGQVVRVDIPSTYGRIVKVVTGQINSGRSRLEDDTTKDEVVGIVIEYMTPIRGLASYDGLRESYYALNGPFRNRFHVIEVSTELDLLKRNGVKARADEAWQRRMFSLDEAVKFLEISLSTTR